MRRSTRVLLLVAAALLAGGCTLAPWKLRIGEMQSATQVDARTAFELAVVPGGWCTSELQLDPDEDGSRTFTVRAVDGSANVISSSEPLDPAMTTRTYADSQETLLREELAGYEQHAAGHSAAYEGDGYERVFTWIPDAAGRIWQIQAYAARDGVGYTTTGTTTIDAPRSVRQMLRRVVTSVRLVHTGDVRTPERCDEVESEPGVVA